MTENTDASKSGQTECSDGSCSRLDSSECSSCRNTNSAPACDACDTTHYVELYDVCLGETEYDVCGDCFQLLVDQIERYHWWDRLTEAHYNRAAEFLRSLDQVWCVKDQAYAGGELWVHTPYCDAAVVRDVCDHFGFQIRWFSVVSPCDEGFECVSEHGLCIEINLIYTNRILNPLPLEDDIQNDVTYHEMSGLKTTTDFSTQQAIGLSSKAISVPPINDSHFVFTNVLTNAKIALIDVLHDGREATVPNLVDETGFSISQIYRTADELHSAGLIRDYREHHQTRMYPRHRPRAESKTPGKLAKVCPACLTKRSIGIQKVLLYRRKLSEGTYGSPYYPLQ